MLYFFLTLNRFCKPGEWVLILHADLFKFHPEPVWQSNKYKLHTSYLLLFILYNANDISILTSTQEAKEWTIYPWIHSNCNSLSDNDQLRPVSFPDIHPSRYLLSHVYHISIATVPLQYDVLPTFPTKIWPLDVEIFLFSSAFTIWMSNLNFILSRVRV
jgi:hypothetical protein